MHNPPIHARPGLAPSGRPDVGADGRRARGAVTLLASVVFVAVAGAAAWVAGSQAFAVGALGFWHYYLYALAFRYGAVPLPVFKRDAVLMKSVALLVLASAYLAAPLDYLSLAIVAGGFGLNTLAARALGSDRTYYGEEVANLLRARVTRFPYSVIAHPMLVGNMLAYGGMLLNAGFREQWWLLACAHVALNLGLLLMERYVTPLRLSAAGGVRPARRWSWSQVLLVTVIGAALAASIVWLAGLGPVRLAAAVGAAAAVYACTLHFAYTAAAPTADARSPAEPETTP
jgi:hypothetical protein